MGGLRPTMEKESRMKLPYKIGQAAYQVFSAGVRYYENGTLKDKATGARLFDYFKADAITPEQVETLRAYCPDVQVKVARSQYAPEIRSALICFPKRAWYARRA